MKTYLALMFATFGLLTAGCVNDSGKDCGDGTIGSESHWANCGANVSTNNSSNDGGITDAGNSGNNTSGNNATSGNNTANNTSGNNTTVGDAGMMDAGSDAGGDAGLTDPNVCYAFRWNDTDRAFDQGRCEEQDDGSFACDCFGAELNSTAATCSDALVECGATTDEVDGCAMTNEAGCAATNDGWECTCQGLDAIFTSTAARCDTAYYESCYTDDFCTAEIGPGLQGRCTPTLDENYVATGFLCGCYADGVENIEPFMINRETCAEAAPLACGE